MSRNKIAIYYAGHGCWHKCLGTQLSIKECSDEESIAADSVGMVDTPIGNVDVITLQLAVWM